MGTITRRTQTPLKTIIMNDRMFVKSFPQTAHPHTGRHESLVVGEQSYCRGELIYCRNEKFFSRHKIFVIFAVELIPQNIVCEIINATLCMCAQVASVCKNIYNLQIISLIHCIGASTNIFNHKNFPSYNIIW